GFKSGIVTPPYKTILPLTVAIAEPLRAEGPETRRSVHVAPSHSHVSANGRASEEYPPKTTILPFRVALAAPARAEGPRTMRSVQVEPLHSHVFVQEEAIDSSSAEHHNLSVEARGCCGISRRRSCNVSLRPDGAVPHPSVVRRRTTEKQHR